MSNRGSGNRSQNVTLGKLRIVSGNAHYRTLVTWKVLQSLGPDILLWLNIKAKFAVPVKELF